MSRDGEAVATGGSAGEPREDPPKRSCILAPGEEAPDFEWGEDGERRSLAERRGVGRTLLLFYPLAFAPVCQQDLRELEQHLGSSRPADLVCLGISVDGPEQARHFFADLELTQVIPVPDSGLDVAAAYGVARPEGFAECATVLVNAEGRVEQSLVHDLCFPRPVKVLCQWVGVRPVESANG